MLSKIQEHLSGHPWADRIHYFDTIDSTNTYAKQLAAGGAPEGTIVIAGRQTGGRGRMGRSFSSPAGMGIYMSVILRPDCLPEELMHLTCAAGVAAVRTIGDPNIGIKWTNDLVLGKRKLGGILTELSADSVSRKVSWVVVGIGINCCQSPADFPPELRQMACSLGIAPSQIPGLTGALIQSLFRVRQELLPQKADLMQEFTSRCITVGQHISVLRGDLVRHGQAISVDQNGGLLVRYTDGTEETVTSGEVSIRGMYGYV